MSVVEIVDHPLIQHKISLLRDRNTGTKEFRDLVSEIAMLLCYEATRDLPTEEVEVETPVALARTKVLAGRKLALVPILRAGLGMVDGMLNLIPAAKVGHIGMYRNEETLEPIRRYPDMMVHRLLARYLADGKAADKAMLEDLCFRASEREVIAAEAERASIKYKMVEFMKERIGEEFEGHISGLTEWGIYVELDETHIEGMSFLRDIDGDFFQFDEANYQIIGRSTGRRMTLGDAVRIRVKRADLQKRQLDFEVLLDGLRTPAPAEGQGPQVRRSNRRKNR